MNMIYYKVVAKFFRVYRFNKVYKMGRIVISLLSFLFIILAFCYENQVLGTFLFGICEIHKYWR